MSIRDADTRSSSLVCDPPVSVYNGYSMSTKTKDYMRSRGLRNALYSVRAAVRAAELTEELFGTLVPCLFQVFIDFLHDNLDGFHDFKIPDDLFDENEAEDNIGGQISALSASELLRDVPPAGLNNVTAQATLAHSYQNIQVEYI